MNIFPLTINLLAGIMYTDIREVTSFIHTEALIKLFYLKTALATEEAEGANFRKVC